jgi:hypothetical protein
VAEDGHAGDHGVGRRFATRIVYGETLPTTCVRPHAASQRARRGSVSSAPLRRDCLSHLVSFAALLVPTGCDATLFDCLWARLCEELVCGTAAWAVWSIPPASPTLNTELLPRSPENPTSQRQTFGHHVFCPSHS